MYEGKKRNQIKLKAILIWSNPEVYVKYYKTYDAIIYSSIKAKMNRKEF